MSMGKSIAIEKNQGIKMLEKGKSQKINDRYISLNPQLFLMIHLLLKRQNLI